MRKPRKNSVKLMLLMDSGGTMIPYSSLLNELFQAVNKSNHYKGIGHVELYIGNNQRFGAHKHYSDHPADDVSIKSYNGGGNLFCRPSSQ